MGFGKISQVLFGRRTGLHANGLVFQLQSTFDFAFHRHHEALAVVVSHCGLAQAQRRITRQSECRVARQDVDLTRLQGRKALLRVQGHVLHFGRIRQDRRRHGFADVHIQATPVAIGIGG